uniref:Interphotoreceptor matrix proteoglycan 2b n=1 Tax=Electrophorus electricus TaxID=8005 RepID=A0AAY5EEZ4_ELEEL
IYQLLCLQIKKSVWEAFKIFRDRLPERDEYQLWVTRCQDGSIAIRDIGRTFSQSDEHLTHLNSFYHLISSFCVLLLSISIDYKTHNPTRKSCSPSLQERTSKENISNFNIQ